MAPELGFQTGSGKDDQDNIKGEEGAQLNKFPFQSPQWPSVALFLTGFSEQEPVSRELTLN